MSAPKVEPGEVVTPVEVVSHSYNPRNGRMEGDRLVTGEHSIADVLRYLISEADAEEVRCVLGSMVGYEAAGPWQEGEPEEHGVHLVHYTHGTYTGYMTALFRNGKCVRPTVPPADSLKIHRHASINPPDEANE